MKLKFDENNHVVVQDGKPVYVHDDGKEIAFDAVQATAKIASLNNEAKQHRQAKEELENKLKAFDGIDDAAAAKKALETVKNWDDKKFIDAGEVEKLKTEMAKTHHAQIAEIQAAKDKITAQFHAEMVGGAFARSPFVAEKIAIPADMLQAAFGKHFSVDENGKLNAKFADGNTIYSRENAGEIAGFDEAIEMLVNAYPHRDSILKANLANGGGSQNSNGIHGNGVPKSLAECKTDEQRIAYLQNKAA